MIGSIIGTAIALDIGDKAMKSMSKSVSKTKKCKRKKKKKK